MSIRVIKACIKSAVNCSWLQDTLLQSFSIGASSPAPCKSGTIWQFWVSSPTLSILWASTGDNCIWLHVQSSAISLVTSRLENLKNRGHWNGIEKLPPAASSLRPKPRERQLLEQTLKKGGGFTLRQAQGNATLTELEGHPLCGARDVFGISLHTREAHPV